MKTVVSTLTTSAIYDFATLGGAAGTYDIGLRVPRSVLVLRTTIGCMLSIIGAAIISIPTTQIFGFFTGPVTAGQAICLTAANDGSMNAPPSFNNLPTEVANILIAAPGITAGRFIVIIEYAFPTKLT